jgi:Icc-related predicted phosphoesterase
MKIWHISDTHQYHDQLTVLDNIDLVIHSGDFTNVRDPIRNESEVHKFLDWYRELNIPNKVLIAGNHDTSLERGLVKGDYIESLGINYLFNDSVTIGGLKIWGSPHTPTFGKWAFMKPRNTISRVWETIPKDTDIIVTHGPPKGFLDITNRRDNLQEQCGCSALTKRTMDIQPKLVCFGHIHNTRDIYNSGTKKIAGLNTIFSNGACATDGIWGKATSNGNVIEL